ncbi:DUF6817 domain-containing protein [Streptomyces cyaneofuscatus]
MSTHAEKVDFLRRHGVDALEHSGADLLAHLQGVHDLLAEWGGDQMLCDVGLFHSVYGTEIFPTGAVPRELRPAVRELVGEEAELLVHLFGTVTRSSIFDAAFDGAPFLLEARTGEQIGVTPEQYRGIAALTVANWLEQRPRFAEAVKFSRAREFDAMRPHLPAATRHALELAYGFAPLAQPTA